MPEGPIKAVLFDLGGTLICYSGISKLAAFWRGARSSHRYLRSCGYSPGPYHWYAFTSIVRLRWELLRSRWTGRDLNVLELFKTIGLRKGIYLTQARWDELVWAWYEPLARLAYTEANLLETIQALHHMGLGLGVLSNTFIPASCLDRHLTQLGLLQYLPVRLYSYQYPFRKPDQRIFIAASEAIGQQPRHILFVGDRLDWDIRPAIRLGMQAALVQHFPRPLRSIPDGAVIISRIGQLPGIIRQINQCVTSHASGGS